MRIVCLKTTAYVASSIFGEHGVGTGGGMLMQHRPWIQPTIYAASHSNADSQSVVSITT